MFKKTLIAAAAAGIIGLGMAATTTSASAAGGSAQFGGPGWSVTIGNGQYHPGYQFHPQRYCQPITKKVKWWDRFGNSHWSVVVVGQKCPPPKFPPHGGPYNPGPFPPHHNGPFPGQHGPGWGW